RPCQGLFVCENCGYKANADFVGAQNIKKRFEDYMSSDGAVVEPALNLTAVKEPLPLVSSRVSQEAPFERWE
ncbi:MAG: zinc ribbon domain-containing protein, partial [Candidatus Aenigmarchaeota archaeon]|nr:zinc ribbon domain-containing protein [Candidatus Aenigmarchaeota archaeon]